MPSDPEIDERLDWLERAVIALSSAPGAPELPPRPGSGDGPSGSAGLTFASDASEAGVTQEVLAFLETGKKVQAIKAYRDATGVGLKEGKEAIERIGRERGLD